ncbi:MAG: MFS transporter [Prolixibacteraceae bacterium]
MKIKNYRWWILGLLCVAMAINYLDRQNFPMVYVEIKKSIAINDAQFGLLSSVFLLTYGTMYAVGGRIVDVLGSRIGYTIIIIWWSLANMLHGLVSGILGLGVARFLLGAGEGGGFPASAKVVSEWVPEKERSFAFGIFNTGSSIGAIIAPMLIYLIVNFFGNWRWTFFIFGAMGLIWVAAWLKLYHKPRECKYITEEEKGYILKDSEPVRPAVKRITWFELFRFRKMWGLMVVKFLTDSAWFFFIFWLPKYLNDIRGLDIQGIGAYAWIPYAMAGVGSFAGGWLSSFLLKKRFSLDISRKAALGMSAALLPASLLITTTSSTLMAILFFGIAMLGHQFWSTIVQTLAVDIFPSKIVGSVAGLMGCIGTYGAMIFCLIIGYVIQNKGYTPAFIISGILHPVSFVLILLIIKKIEPVSV